MKRILNNALFAYRAVGLDLTIRYLLACLPRWPISVWNTVVIVILGILIGVGAARADESPKREAIVHEFMMKMREADLRVGSTTIVTDFGLTREGWPVVFVTIPHKGSQCLVHVLGKQAQILGCGRIDRYQGI